jgi:signal peptidase I
MVEELPHHSLGEPGPRTSPAFSWLRSLAETVFVAVILALFVRSFLLQAFRIPSSSMEPSLLVGDQILVNKFIYGPTLYEWERSYLPVRTVARGDVVVFRFPENPKQEYIKRSVGLPGDRIRLREKELLVNDWKVPESRYVKHIDPRIYPNSLILPDLYRFRDNYGPYVVPEDRVFFLGDNRDRSHDSRFWGPVSLDLVRGRALLIYWSFQTEPEGPDGGLSRSRWLLDAMTRTRWDRTLRSVR